MPPAPSITNADEAKIVSILTSARRRWLYMAPGITQPIVEAMDALWARLGGASGSVILDLDPEVYRLGYGTLEGLQQLQEAATRHGTLICRHQDGIRIGLVISDDHTLIFTPTPLLIEAGPTCNPAPPCPHSAWSTSSPPPMSWRKWPAADSRHGKRHASSGSVIAPARRQQKASRDG